MRKRMAALIFALLILFGVPQIEAAGNERNALSADFISEGTSKTETGVRMREPYSYVGFKSVNMTGMNSISVKATCSLAGDSDGDKIQVRIDSDKGRLLGYVDIGVHSPDEALIFKGSIEKATGVHDLYLVSSIGTRGDTGTENAMLISFELSEEEYDAPRYEPIEDSDITDMKYTALSATDSLGRKVAGYSEVGPLKEDKYVGLFYWTWHSKFEGHTNVINNTEFAKLHPDAKYDYNNKAWPAYGAYFWNEPLFGYYGGSDYWVYRKHAEMLALAGVDVVFFDCTNATHSYRKAYTVLLNAFHDARNDGVLTPKVAYVCPMGYASGDTQVDSFNKEAVKRVYLNVYQDQKWSDLWFYWEGKPLILAYEDKLKGREGDEEDSFLMNDILDFFTFRGINGAFDTGQFRDNQWSWLEIYPQNGYTPTESGGFEEISVGASVNYSYKDKKMTAMNSEYSMGRSYTALLGDNRSENSDLYGYFFTEQLNHALTVDAKMLFVDGWNEWNAGRYASWGGVTNAFPDTYDDESSRDLEPTKGRLKDNYYMLLCDAARKWKGALPVETAGSDKTINITDFSSWAGVTPEYLSPKGTYNRNATGYGKTEFINNTKRNVVTKSLATKDANYMYFYAECENTITDAEGDKWMKLYIDSDRNHATGWEGYDFVINYPSPGDVSAYNGEYEKIGTAEYFVSGNKLALKIEKELINTSEFEFKWADNVSGDIMDYYSYGHTSPMGRFNYVYTKEKEVYKGDDRLAGTAIVKPGENYAYYSGKKIYVYEPDTRVKIIEADGEVYIPAYFLNDAFGLLSEYDAQRGIVRLKGEKKAYAVVGALEARCDGYYKKLSHPAMVLDGTVYVPASFMKEVFGLEVYTFGSITAIGNKIDRSTVEAFVY